MRSNQPVFDREFPFPEGETLVSTTDLDSYITYCNPAFVRVSGYEEAELVGQPHNLIRHPDMPAEAFRDMWETLRAGKPWSGMVKNRRKDGSFYWVMANVTPVLKDGRPAGYMSVRTRPTREQIRSAEQLYARMRSEAAEGNQRLALQRGFVVSRTPWGRLRNSLRMTAGRRIALALAGTAIFQESLNVIPGASSLPEWAHALIAAGTAIAAGYYLTRTVVAPLDDLTQAANRIAAGDLSQTFEVTRRDQVGELQRAISQVSVNLQAVVRDVSVGVREISTSAVQVSDGGQQLSARTESQASSLQETAASMEQLTSTVAQSASNTLQATQLAKDASGAAQSGQQAMSEVAQRMQHIDSASRKVGEIVELIEGIAFQTNILSLNAAVEAARAGEAGRGFSVVASEVRKLAKRSADAAKEIRTLIAGAVEEVASGNEAVDAARRTVESTVASVERVHQLIQELAQTAKEQSDGISQVNEAVSSLDNVTQQNAALVEESSAVALTLKERTRELTSAVSVFRV